MPNDPNVSRTIYVATLGGVGLGEYEKMDPSTLKALYSAVTIGSMGPVVLDHRSEGALDGTFEPQLKQLTAARVAALCPWQAGPGNPWLPPQNKMMGKEYGKELRIHPKYMGTDTSKDVVFSCAVNHRPFSVPSDGKTDDVYTPEFHFYPVIQDDGTWSYGRVGA